jgi:ribosomal-protein-alanine N-acetyltransferase
VEQGLKSRADIVAETERLLLRPMRAQDAGALVEVYCDPHAMRYYPRPYTREEVDERIAANQAAHTRNGHGLYSVVLKSTGDIVGDCGPALQQVDGTNEIEIGYHFLPRFWGRGYAAEAARASRDWAFENLDCDRVISLIRPVNVPSQHVAARNGMKIVKAVIWRELAHDVWAIRRAEWQARFSG